MIDLNHDSRHFENYNGKSNYVLYSNIYNIEDQTYDSITNKNNYEVLKSIWDKHQDEEIASYVNLLSQQNALTSSINWYRANYELFNQGFDIGMIDVPVLFVWGNKDNALKRSGVEWTEDYVTGYYRFVELNAGHWLIQESYEKVQEEIVSHLKKF